MTSAVKTDRQFFKDSSVIKTVKAALKEDMGGRDITTDLCVPVGKKGKARLEARQAGVAAGLPLAKLVFAQLDESVKVSLKVKDGESFKKGQVLAEIRGPLRPILSGERVFLNFAQRLCGIATLTRRFVEAVKGSGVEILDTRKTTPGLRQFEKYAVRCGGGRSHRATLAEAVLIKDNHRQAAGSVARAVAVARQYSGDMPVQAEVESLSQAREAAQAGASSLLLDNMRIAAMKTVAAEMGKELLLEASGGITLTTAAAIASTGVHRLSIGALTHSAPALDLSLEVETRG
jgi:nicotinate-nucleotide pyrophosphorylase (carboxylating)